MLKQKPALHHRPINLAPLGGKQGNLSPQQELSEGDVSIPLNRSIKALRRF
jgi:hypothetical protein